MTDFSLNTSPARKLLSKPVTMTLGCSLAALSIIILARGVIAAFTGTKLDIYSSLYFMFGSGSVLITNLIMTILLAAGTFFLAIGLFSARSSAKSSGSVSLLKTASVVSIVITSLLMLVSFASVSVLNYAQISEITSTNPNGTSIAYYAYNGNTNGLFWGTLLLGAAVLMAEISLIRLANGLSRNMTAGETVKPGTALLSISALSGAVIAGITFCAVLYQLVTPSELYRYSIYNDLQTSEALAPANLALNSLNVLLFACAVVFFVTATIIGFSYAASIDTINRANRTQAYSNQFVASNPQNLPDYTTPANYQYNQPQTFTPVYDANRYYQAANRNIYAGEVPPVPAAPVNPFKPQPSMTQYPAQTPAAPAASEAAAEKAPEAADAE